jgi:pimeloyl-ACP methyl ester carboxylesterase
MQTDSSEATLTRPTEWWPAPAAPETPAAYNAIAVRRFRRAGAGRPAAVLILSPGFTGGINLFDYLAEEVTAAGDGRLEVWTTERRNNRLEDPRGMERAEAAGDPRVALDYYFPGEPAAVALEEDAGQRLLSQQEAAYSRHWGLALALADLRVVVQRARAAVGAGKLFLGGHSLGGMLAQCYAAWEFAEGPGHREIDGLVLIDGAVGGTEWTRATGLAQYEADLEAIRGGEFYWNDPGKGATPRFGVLGQVAAMAAAFPAWRDRPSLVAPLVPDLPPLPPGVALTNEAFLGLAIDAETSPIPNYRAHVGRLSGEGAVVRSEHLSHPRPSSLPPPRHWLSYRETGELTDLRRIAGALLQRGGANGIEWYASRLLNAEVDLSSNLDSRHPDTAALAAPRALRLWHHGEEALPVFGVVTGASEQKRERYQWYAATVAATDVTILDAPEQEHLDPLFAENDGHNRYLPALIEWLLARASGP